MPTTELAAPRRDRVEFVDSLRGFALLGVFAANLVVFSGYGFLDDTLRAALPTAGLDKFIETLELVFIENKFMGLFSFLFGVSFWLFLSRPNARAKEGTGLYYWRVFWLFVIGCVHGWLFWCFDILRFYALWGILLPLFLRTSRKTLLYCALIAAILAPALIKGLQLAFLPTPADDINIDSDTLQAFANGSFVEMLRANWNYDWYLTNSIGQVAYQVAVLGRMLFGLWVGRELIFENLAGNKRLLRNVFVGGALVGIIGNLISWEVLFEWPDSRGFILPFMERLIAETGYLSLTLAFASGLGLLWQGRVWEKPLRRLAPFGRMALTSYLTHTILCLWIFYGFMPGPHLVGKIGPTWLLPIWGVVLVAQIWLSDIWLRHFRYGPAEWLWRVLTYRRLLPLRISADT